MNTFESENISALKSYINTNKFIMTKYIDDENINNALTQMSSCHEYDENKYRLIIVDIKKINKEWKKNCTDYIKNFSSITNYMDKAKYISIMNDIVNNNLFSPCILYIKDELLCFKSGRNKFSAIKNLGRDEMCCLVKRDEESMFEAFKKN